MTLYRSYAKARVGLAFFVERANVVERYGFANLNSAAGSIVRAWKRNGWPTHSQAAAHRLSTKSREGRGIVGGRFTEHELRQLHTLHTRVEKMSANELARRVYERKGYASPSSCLSTILNGWKALGLKSRDRIEMVVAVTTTNGLSPRNSQERKLRRRAAGLTAKGKAHHPKCVGTKPNGKRCTRPSMGSSVYCWQHDPDPTIAVEREAHLARMRRSSPLANRGPLVEWEPTRQRILEAHEFLSWEELGVALGVKPETVENYASKKSIPITASRARRYRLALDAALGAAEAEAA